MGIDHLFSKRKTTGDRPRGSSTFADPRAGAGVYVDMENLRDDVLRDGTKRTSTSQETIRRKEIVRGQQVIRTLLDTWPQGVPKPQRLSLYVRADLVEVWRLSSVDQFPGLEVEVRGVQHFSSSAKNTADIALAADAIADLVLGRVGYVAVVSDDSDFISLYAKVREEMERANSEIRVVPFLWVVTDRPRTVSASVRDYFPDRHLHVIHWEENGRQSPGIDPVANVPRTAASPHRPAAAPRPVAPAPRPAATPRPIAPAPTPVPPASPVVASAPPAAAEVARDGSVTWEEMARTIAREMPVGSFKSADCQGIIRKHWPGHPLTTASGPRLGNEFKRTVWPLLEKWGAREAPGQKPRRYYMTEEAKAGALGAEVVGSPGQAEVVGSPGQAEVVGSPGQAEVGGSPGQAEVGGSPDQAEVGGSPDQAEVGGSPDQAEVGGSPDQAEVGGSPDQAEVGGSPDQAEVGGSPDQAEVGLRSWP